MPRDHPVGGFVKILKVGLQKRYWPVGSMSKLFWNTNIEIC